MRHEQTIVYQRSLALMETAQRAIEQFPKGLAFLGDQLRRNTSSVHQNFAEGYYQDSRAQQRRFFGYAIQSAREASASFDAALAFHGADEAIVAQGKALALEIVRMLSKFSVAEKRPGAAVRADLPADSETPALDVVRSRRAEPH